MLLKTRVRIGLSGVAGLVYRQQERRERERERERKKERKTERDRERVRID